MPRSRSASLTRPREAERQRDKAVDKMNKLLADLGYAD